MAMNNNREGYMEEDYVHIGFETGTEIEAFIELNALLEQLYNNMNDINRDDYISVAREVVGIMTHENIKNHPLFLFLPAIDLSFSIVKSAPNDLKIELVADILDKYLAFRYTNYNNAESLSMLATLAKDRGSSRKNGESAIKKMRRMVGDNFVMTQSNTLVDMNNNEYALVDKQNKNLFFDLVNQHTEVEARRKDLKSKKPDFLFKQNDSLFLMEHKHMKEMGGAQDKQLKEVVEFIKNFASNNLGIKPYGFIDGVYYNKILDAYTKIITSGMPTRSNKILRAAEWIIGFEEEYGYCPIINTDEFRILLNL